MSSRLPALSAPQLVRVLRREGFVQVRQTGSHMIFRHPDGRRTTVPAHAGRTLGRGLLRQIMRDANLTTDDLLK